MMFPGASGGSLAIIFCMYDELILMINNIFKDFSNSFKYLLVFTSFVLLGIFVSSNFLSYFFIKYTFELSYLFVGIVFAFTVRFIIDSNIKNDKWYYMFVILLGIALSVSITFVKGINIDTNNYFSLFLIGIILAISLILPGISISYVLLLIGIYNDLIIAIKNFELLYLLKIGISLIIGIILSIKIISFLINRYKRFANNLIIGFMIGSVFLIMPKINNSNDLLMMIVFLSIGLLTSLFLLKQHNN